MRLKYTMFLHSDNVDKTRETVCVCVCVRERERCGREREKRERYCSES